MTDRLQKSLEKLSEKERQKLKQVLFLIKDGNFSGLDLKKLKTRDDIFRVRKGKMRIIFRKTGKTIDILAVERRSNITYDF